ncbi:MAG: hypothetical protein ABIO16_02115 [Nocardioides sp.]
MSNASLVAASRQAWSGLEALHIVGYFADEPRERYVALGLHPRLSYFAARSAAMGAVGPEVTFATFYVLAPWLHQKALPAAWGIASPEQVVEARRDGVRAAMARILGSPDIAEALAIARRVTEGLSPSGRPLYAAHAGLDWPEDDLVALWHAAGLVREHRGDGHVAVLTAAGIAPLEAMVLDGAWSDRREFLKATRGWTEEEIASAAAGLVERGWLAADETLTDEGRAVRAGVEERTDTAAMSGWEHVGPADTARLAELMAPLRATIVESGLLPPEIQRALTRIGETGGA